MDGATSSGCEIAVLVPRRGADEILARLDDDASTDAPWRLPSIEVVLGDDLPLARALEAATDALGMPLIPLRFILRETDAEREPTLIVLEAEPLETPPPEGLRWVEPGAVRGRLAPAGVDATLDWWLERGRDGADVQGPWRRPAWTRPGWHDRAAAWMVDRMTAAGRPADGPPSTIQAWPLAVVLRAPSTGGPCFLKCAGPMFAHEASITRALAGRMPGHVPEVIAIEPDENWLLMGDLGADIVGLGPAEGWGDGLARLAELQLAWAGEPVALIRAGLPRRPLAALAADLPGFLGQNGLGDRLRPAVRDEWDAAVPRFVEACERLDGLGVPDTVVHGDFHPWNVARTSRGLVVFDWSDASLGPPFVDLPTTLGRTPDVAIRRSLADRYLAAWPEVADADRPRVADLAMLVGSLYQVQSYLGFLGTIDPMESLDLAGADASWLGRSLEALEHGIAAGRRTDLLA